MNKKFLVAWLVVFVLWMGGSFVVHGILLHDDYSRLPNLFRPDAEASKLMHFMLLAHVVMAGAFVWIYQRGCELKPWMPQGIRFGLAIALLGPLPMYTIYYVVQPTTARLAVGQAVYDSLLVVILGIVVAFLYRHEGAAPASSA